jgi:hypothetical protein
VPMRSRREVLYGRAQVYVHLVGYHQVACLRADWQPERNLPHLRGNVFNDSSSSVHVVAVSTKLGGAGISLICADRAFITYPSFDSMHDWSRGRYGFER